MYISINTVCIFLVPAKILFVVILLKFKAMKTEVEISWNLKKKFYSAVHATF